MSELSVESSHPLETCSGAFFQWHVLLNLARGKLLSFCWCLARSKGAGRPGLAKTRSSSCERLCRALRTNWISKLPTPTPLDNPKSRSGTTRIVRAFSTVVKVVKLASKSTLPFSSSNLCPSCRWAAAIFRRRDTSFRVGISLSRMRPCLHHHNGNPFSKNTLTDPGHLQWRSKISKNDAHSQR